MIEPGKIYQLLNRKPKIEHYYGDIVRLLFLLTGVLMLFLLPFFVYEIPVSIYTALLIVLILSIIAGLTNPKQMYFAFFDALIAAVGTGIMGYFAVQSYIMYSALNLYFWTNEILAVIFLIALYYSVKTVRGFLVAKSSSKKIE